MNREDLHIRDRLLMLAECSNPQKPFNIKRKSNVTKQISKVGSSNKMSMQDFVRMDPGYTPDIEHLVFPSRKRNPQQVAPINPAPAKTRSRLAEMFALSRHLQQRSADRETKSRSSNVNRSVDSVLEQPRVLPSNIAPLKTPRQWTVVEEPVRQTSSGSTRVSPAVESDMATTRGPNVSVLHLRSTSEPWETSPTSAFVVSTGSSRSSYSTGRTTTSISSSLTKQQSLNAQYNKWSNTGGGGGISGGNAGFHSGGEVNSTEIFLGGSCSREISPVRWCDREVDGVYLGKSGWVQVQQRSLDENRRSNYNANVSHLSSSSTRRPGIKLSDYHFNSEPERKCIDMNRISEPQRPIYLPIQSREYENREYERKTKTPSPRNVPQSFSPPNVTPIISPPPAFQDKTSKSRTFFGKAPFLPRSDAIVDSDASPDTSPKPIRKPIVTPIHRKPKLPTPSPSTEQHRTYPRIPQTKSLEDTTSNRRNQFLQKYGESSSSSSSSMGFRSLDSYVARPVMPRLSENTDSSAEVYEDADDEDNNSSSLNLSIQILPLIEQHQMRNREKISPTNRRSSHHRTPPRRSPAGSDSNRHQSSSSSSCDEFLNPNQTRRNKYQVKSPQQDDSASLKVRRSKSLQLPDKKIPSNFKENASSHQRLSPQQRDTVHPRLSPQHVETQQQQQRPLNKVPSTKKHNVKMPDGESLDEDMLREAEVVTSYLYGNRNRAAAQAHLIHRYNNSGREEKAKEHAKNCAQNNIFNVYYVGKNNKEQRHKMLQRGLTTSSSISSKPNSSSNSCNHDTCDFWPHCASRESLNTSMMRLSQSYPSHQKSLESPISVEPTRPNSVALERTRDAHKKRMINRSETEPKTSRRPNILCDDIQDKTDNRLRVERRPSPNRNTGSLQEKKSPINRFSNVSSSSSSSDVYITTSDRTTSKSPKNVKSSGASTPLDDISNKDDKCHEEGIMSRPGSAPNNENKTVTIENQQRSMSLPKSFLSASHQPSCQFPWRRRGTDSLGSSPGIKRKTPSETSQTAPVTPLHENNRRRSPIGTTNRRAKATSTPHLLVPTDVENRKWDEKHEINEDTETNLNPNPTKDFISRRTITGNTTESVLQKFRKTFSLRFQKKGSKDSCVSDLGDTLTEYIGEPSEEDSPQRVITSTNVTGTSGSSGQMISNSKDQEQTEQKHKFGPLIWRSSKERKKLNKAARNAKCNSGDSGIQIEMAPGCGGAGGDSSESHDTDQPGDDLDSPPAIRRRQIQSGKSNRPHSDLLNQILIDKFKAELRSRAHKHQHVRRTHSDLGGQRLLNWDSRSSYRRMMSSPAPLRGRPQSPRKKPPDIPGGVQLRGPHRRGQLRRSLSQPLDIDKLSPLMRTKGFGMKLGGTVFSEDEHDVRGGTSDDEMMSDSESSVASLSERKKSLELAMDEDVVILAEAVFDHVAIEAEELAFRAGDVIEVLETANRDWWWGSADGKTGWFPAAFVRLRVSQEDTVEDCLAAMESGRSVPSQVRRRTSISLLSNDQVRTSVVRELVHTERDFVKVLQDVAEGYLAECRKRKDMFSREQIDTIFINLEDILKFQSAFLKDLESSIDWDAPHKSCVGQCFIKHRDGFKMYSDYCNSHPMATATLQELYQYNSYSKFFEACRLMRGLIEIPLDGYLLTPVQRICKYPLQLAELLKYTKPEHSDYQNIKEALETMRGVAVLINERKRRMESLEKLAAWQQRVEAWEGEDLIETSSQLIYQGEVVRVTSGMWTSSITLFMFDKQIVYCKKDIIKRNTYVYKGRMCMETTEIIDIPDGKDVHLGVTVRHGIKLHSVIRDKWLLFCCRSSAEKQRWLQAFSEERQLVAKDKSDGLEFHSSAKQLARVAAKCQRRPPRKPRSDKSYKRDASYMGSALQLNSNNSNSLGRKVGTWFTFGGNKKTRQHRDVS